MSTYMQHDGRITSAATEEKHLRQAVQHANDHADAAIADLANARAEIDRLNSALQSAVAQVSDLATRLGQAEGKLLMSETVGVVEDWRDRCRKLEEALRQIDVGNGWAAQIARAALSPADREGEGVTHEPCLFFYRPGGQHDDCF